MAVGVFAIRETTDGDVLQGMDVFLRSFTRGRHESIRIEFSCIIVEIFPLFPRDRNRRGPHGLGAVDLALG